MPTRDRVCGAERVVGEELDLRRELSTWPLGLAASQSLQSRCVAAPRTAATPARRRPDATPPGWWLRAGRPPTPALWRQLPLPLCTARLVGASSCTRSISLESDRMTLQALSHSRLLWTKWSSSAGHSAAPERPPLVPLPPPPPPRTSPRSRRPAFGSTSAHAKARDGPAGRTPSPCERADATQPARTAWLQRARAASPRAQAAQARRGLKS